MSELVANLSDNKIKAFINNGYGITESGVTNSDGVIVFEIMYEDANIFPMFAVDFHEYLAGMGFVLKR